MAVSGVSHASRRTSDVMLQFGGAAALSHVKLSLRADSDTDQETGIPKVRHLIGLT